MLSPTTYGSWACNLQVGDLRFEFIQVFENCAVDPTENIMRFSKLKEDNNQALEPNV